MRWNGNHRGQLANVDSIRSHTNALPFHSVARQNIGEKTRGWHDPVRHVEIARDGVLPSRQRPEHGSASAEEWRARRTHCQTGHPSRHRMETSDAIDRVARPLTHLVIETVKQLIRRTDGK